MFCEPMYAQAIDVLPEHPEHFELTFKADGWRCLATVALHDSAELTTRTGNRITSLPYISAALSEICPPGTVLDGELVDLVSERQWNRTQSICSSTTEHHASIEDPPLTYVVFDILMLDGENLMHKAQTERRKALETLFEDHDAGAVVLIEQHPCTSASVEAIVARGYEGVVLKRLDSRYRPGMRDGSWLKLKAQAETEAICTGTFEGKGKYAGGEQVGGVCFRLPNGREGRASGMTDQVRRDMAAHPERYVGRVIELAHHGETADGLLRHPQFRRVRDPQDKATATEDRAARKVRKAPEKISAGGRTRNYNAMGDAKLLQCIAELQAGGGDAYRRCMNRGSSEPEKDLEVARGLASKRGLS